MARPRKVLQLQSGHLESEFKSRRMLEESLVKGDSDELDNVPAGLLCDAVAKAEYKRILDNLRKLDLVANLDRNNLIMLSNAWSDYTKYRKQMKHCDDPTALYYLQKSHDKTVQIIKSLESTLGMTMDARLKAGAAKAQTQEAEMESKFGVI